MHTPLGELGRHDEFSIAHSLMDMERSMAAHHRRVDHQMAHTTKEKGAQKTWLPRSGTIRIQSWLDAQETRCYTLTPILSSAKALRVQLQSR